MMRILSTELYNKNPASSKVRVALLAGISVAPGRHAKLIFMVLWSVSALDAGQPVAVITFFIFCATAETCHSIHNPSKHNIPFWHRVVLHQLITALHEDNRVAGQPHSSLLTQLIQFGYCPPTCNKSERTLRWIVLQRYD